MSPALAGFAPDTNVAMLEPPERLSPFLRSLGFITKDEEARLAALRRARFFLVKNGTTAMAPARCKRCAHIHPYFTQHCIELPFRGLRDALVAYAKVTTNDERVRVIQMLGLPDLASDHPQTARTLRPSLPGEDMLGFAIGMAEPIPESTARRYERRIQDRNPKFRIQ